MITEECLVKWWSTDDADSCAASPRVCSECVRALALQWWGAIARHAHDGDSPLCVLCGMGEATYCAEHALDAVLKQRGALVDGGTTIGEPERWPL